MVTALVSAWVLVLLLALLYVHRTFTTVKRPTWNRLPARPGLPPDMEFQCWSIMDGFDAGELSDAVVCAVDCLSVPLGRATVFSSLCGARLLVYVAVNYPGDSCSPAIIPGLNGSMDAGSKSGAVESTLSGLAHTLAHIIERKAGLLDITHSTWGSRGIQAAVDEYARKRAKYV